MAQMKTPGQYQMPSAGHTDSSVNEGQDYAEGWQQWVQQQPFFQQAARQLQQAQSQPDTPGSSGRPGQNSHAAALRQFQTTIGEMSKKSGYQPPQDWYIGADGQLGENGLFDRNPWLAYALMAGGAAGVSAIPAATSAATAGGSGAAAASSGAAVPAVTSGVAASGAASGLSAAELTRLAAIQGGLGIVGGLLGGQDRQSFSGRSGTNGVSVDPTETLSHANGMLQGLTPMLQDRVEHPSTPQTQLQTPQEYTGGGLTNNIGVTGRDPGYNGSYSSQPLSAMAQTRLRSPGQQQGANNPMFNASDAFRMLGFNQ